MPVLLPQPPLVQVPPVPLAAPGIVDLLTALVAATTSLAPSLVRPRWQPTPPEQPPAGTPWAAVGVTRRTGQGYTHQVMSTLPGTATEALLVRRWAAFEALVSFYGPNGDDLAELFRDSVQLNQNLAGLYLYGVKVTGVGDVQAVPDLVNLQWIDHQDVPFDLVREFDRYYPVRSILQGIVTVTADVLPEVVNQLVDSDGHLLFDNDGNAMIGSS